MSDHTYVVVLAEAEAVAAAANKCMVLWVPQQGNVSNNAGLLQLYYSYIQLITKQEGRIIACTITLGRYSLGVYVCMYIHMHDGPLRIRKPGRKAVPGQGGVVQASGASDGGMLLLSVWLAGLGTRLGGRGVTKRSLGHGLGGGLVRRRSTVQEQPYSILSSATCCLFALALHAQISTSRHLVKPTSLRAQQ